MNQVLDFPHRYRPLKRLGSGGGGEVWAVSDRYTKQRCALKVLAERASEHEMAALVREAVALSGLEGLGVPRVIHFGRLAGSRRPFMVRELVEGSSLEQLTQGTAPTLDLLIALAQAAEQLTQVHRAGFFHGDVKPANIIVQARATDGNGSPREGCATLVDLGLAAPWRDAGIEAPGLTPKYAAPELLAGGPLTVRAEVYALGVALRDIVERGERSLDASLVRALLLVAQRATAVEPGSRHPSADEFATALRRAAGVQRPPEDVDPAAMWPVVGIEGTASRLFQKAILIQPGCALGIVGEPGSGRSVLLRRLAWSLGVEGRPLVWVDVLGPSAVLAELDAYPDKTGLLVLVDDADQLSPQARGALVTARTSGACVIAVLTTPPSGELFGEVPAVFEVPALGHHAATELLKRAIPSLTERNMDKLLAAAGGRPGRLRQLVGRLARHAVASEADVDQLLGDNIEPAESLPMGDPLTKALAFLARGRYNEAAAELEQVTEGDPLVIAVAHARLRVGLGEGRAALDGLQALQPEAERRAGTQEAKAWTVWLARAHVALAHYTTALDLLAGVRDEPGWLGAEALAFEGLALSHVDDYDGALASLRRAVEVACEAGDPRVQGLALTCLGLVQQRADALEEAEEAYHQALGCAQTAGDAAILGTVQLNLAVLLKVRGDVAKAIEHFEAARDMGRRSGRLNTIRHALLQLANADLYLGRLARARSSIEALTEQRAELPAAFAAQLLGAEAELYFRTEELGQAVVCYRRCAEEYERLGSGVDSAEARLEGVLAGARMADPDVNELSEEVARAKAQLGDSSAHRALVLLASAHVAMVGGDDEGARVLLEQGLAAAKDGGQRDWVWWVLETRAELEERVGQPLMARRDRVEAVTVLEEIGARLSRDLREVFWNDPRRRKLRSMIDLALSSAPTQMARTAIAHDGASSISSSISAFTQTPLEHRLARLLEINQELLGELDLQRLAAKAVGHAVELLNAERGFVILRDEGGELQVYSSSTKPGDSEHLQFSRSIAEEVMDSREAVVSTDARADDRLQAFSSVHQLLLQSVACVPIVARLQEPIGALYVETRRRSGRNFTRELPTLRAFADQVALAIETRRLIAENQQRAEQLARANTELTEAQGKLTELLGARTASLKQARKKLRDARDTLYGHFGYQGIVGTSSGMRRCYSLIDRVKNTDVPVLITGDSGTGKEVVARAIHRGSERGKQPFLGVNCGAIPEHLLESELFGHVRGAFTGADKERKGIFREAHSGTVLLDEIGEMPQKMQAGLLRVLQERKVRPVGGVKEEPVDCRFLFATHRDLERMVQEGRFREDLYYRIHVVEMPLPPLRERLDDIPLLVDHFLGIFAARYNRERKSFTKAALRRLATYDWPGNVRQLEHVLLNAWVLSERPEIDADDLELPTRRSSPVAATAPPLERVAANSNAVEEPPSLRADADGAGARNTLSAHRLSEKERIIEALEACNWNRVKAAELSGIPRRTFYRRLREYKIQ